MKFAIQKNKTITPSQKKTRLLYFLSFIIPVSIMMIIFFIRDIYPFGERSFLHIDMYHQYFPFLVEFYHKLKNGESLFYSWNTGIGSNFLALYVYYLASPFNWLVIFCSENHLMEFITYMIVFKIGLCGMTFTHYMRRHYRTNNFSIIFFAVFYALSGYMAAYNWNVMWLDCIVLAPLIILGLEELVNHGNFRLYTICLGLSILSNYYLSIMICIFLVLYFFVLLISKEPTEENTAKDFTLPGFNRIHNFYAKAVIRFGVFSLIAGGMAAILLLPELAALKFTEFSDINFPSTIKTYFSVIDMLARHCFNVTVETGLDHWPNIYCGVAVFLLLPLYVMQKNIPMRQKAPKLILLAFILISFSTNALNFIWHGFNYPDSLPARQSFLYIFLLLTVCFEALAHIRESSRNEILAAFLGVLFFILLCEKLITDDSFTSGCFLFTGIFLILYATFMHFYRSGKFSVPMLWILFATVIVESGVNTYLTSVPTVSRTTYLSNYDSYQILTTRTMENENDFFRFEKFARRTQNDAMLIGFPSASYFSSTSNALVKDFYKKYGMKSSRVYYCYDGATPVTAALLSNRYMLYTIDRGYDNMFELADTEGKLYLYKNNYTLPLGYMISSDMVSNSDISTISENHNALDTSDSDTSSQYYNSDTNDLLDELFSDAEEVEENMHDDSTDKNDGLNPIERQNALVSNFGISEPVFTLLGIEQSGDSATIQVSTSGHLYAYTKNTKIDDIELSGDCKSKTFSSIKKKYILDLGYHEADSTLYLSAKNGENLNISVYRIEEEPLSQFIDCLSTQTMTVDSYDETHITGHINVENAGELVLSVPYESGWTVFVDGVESDIDLFENMMISVYLTEGEHTISLSYYPDGLNIGIVLSIISILIFSILCIYTNKKQR